MIDRAIGIAGLALAIVAPVLPTLFPRISKRCAWAGCVFGIMLLAIAGGTLLLLSGDAQPASSIVAPGNSGIITQGQTGGTNVVVQGPRRLPLVLYQCLDDVLGGSSLHGPLP